LDRGSAWSAKPLGNGRTLDQAEKSGRRAVVTNERKEIAKRGDRGTRNIAMLYKSRLRKTLRARTPDPELLGDRR
ncbi:12106_t:CDS:2, partial [Acaulospora colombiana]